MPVTHRPPTTPHATHDLVLLAAAADRHADAGLRSAAEAQLAACPDCAALASDLRSLAAGLADLPSSRPAPRDMRLSVEQASRLRRGRLWRVLLRPFGTAGLPGLRPLAATLTTLGLAGLLMTAIPLGLGAGSASMALPGSRAVDTNAGEAGVPGGSVTPAAAASSSTAYGPDATPTTPQAAESQAPASLDSAGAQASPGAVFSDVAVKGATGSDSHGYLTNAPPSSTTRDAASPLGGVPPLAVVSVALLAVGLALLSLRAVARRVD
jgi:hypothetical protein